MIGQTAGHDLRGPNRIVSSTDRSPLLGDRIARMTTAIGIKPCGGCKKRQQQVNQIDQAVRDFSAKFKK